MIFSKIIEKKFDAVLGRYDGSPACYYFSTEDFPEIKKEEYDIPADRNILLKGAFYYYGTPSFQNIVIFDHGIGAGHLAYFKEIEYLAKKGYTVYSYDHTGCVSTKGSGILGFATAVNDLDHVLTFMKKDPRFQNADYFLVGHSWGGYAIMNAAALHPEVKKIVSLAGFLSARTLIEQYLPKFVLKYAEEVMERERKNNPKYADMDARTSLLQTSASLLYIQSTDDLMVGYDRAFLPLQKALSNRENTVFLSVNGRNHEPQHTDHAVKVYGDFKKELEYSTKKQKLKTKEQQEAFLKQQNWEAMTEQDPEIWKKIFDFLEKH